MIIPYKYHGRLNETFAGLGQMLQKRGRERDELMEELLNVTEENQWMIGPIEELLARYIKNEE
jgi:hypothetical protein